MAILMIVVLVVALAAGLLPGFNLGVADRALPCLSR